MPAVNDILTVDIKLSLNDDEAAREGALLILEKIKPSWERELISFEVSIYF